MASSLEEWLKFHELAEFRSAFEEQDIRLTDLPHLTDTDLRELGMPIGPRRRLLAAVSQLSATQPTEQASDFPIKVSGSPEVRHLTILFADVVGSSHLSEDLDIELYRNLLHDYQTVCSKAVETQHGHLAQFQGDGVVAYFGYPSAEEDDAERAVLTGLQICRDVARFAVSSGEPVKVRVGIATGDVVIDAREGHGVHALGEATNLAARTQAVTEPDSVAVTDDTKALLGANFECEFGGKYELKGFSNPVGMWIVRDARDMGLRFQSRQHGKITPIVGREDELLLLESRWNSVQRNGSQFVMLAGEAGIGKSRMAEELSLRIPRHQRARLSFQCLPNHGGSAFHPVIDFISHAARISRTDNSKQRLEKLKGLLFEWTGTSEAMLPVFASLLSIPLSGNSEHADMPPEQLKQRLQDALVSVLRGLAKMSDPASSARC